MIKTTTAASIFADADLSGWTVRVDLYADSHTVYFSKGSYAIFVHDDGFHVRNTDDDSLDGTLAESVPNIEAALALCSKINSPLPR